MFLYKELRIETQKAYQKAVNQFIKYHPNLPIEDVTERHILKWRQEVTKRVKPVTWNNYLRHLRSLFNFAKKKAFITSENPFKEFFIREDEAPYKLLSSQQITKIANISNKPDIFQPSILQPIWFTKCLVNTFRYTGIRRGQLLKLTISNIDLEQGLIIIPSHINKNHTYHQIPIPRKIYAQLTKLIQEMKKHNQKSSDQLFNINIFSNHTLRKQKMMNNDQLSYIFRTISYQVGFYVSPHRFRHSLATELMKEPQNIYLTKQLLGYKSLKTTLSYIRYDPETLRDVLDSL